MLAFLPAVSLAAYWAGGEILLVFCALMTPLVYAATGGFGNLSGTGLHQQDRMLTPVSVAEDFLHIALSHGQTTACFQLGISGFKDVARSLGEDAVQEARAILRQRLMSVLRNSDHVFDIGDDRFAILISPGFRLKLDSLLDMTKRIRETIEEPVILSGVTSHLTVAIGVSSSLSLGRNVTAEKWLNAASQALSEAVLSGHSATRVWSDKLDRKHNARRALREDLASAFDKGEIQAHFQPQISVRTGRLVGMEALARWEHPRFGLVQPGEFLRALDDSGQMDQLARLMLAQSLNGLQHWDAAGLDVPVVSVNLSAAELRNPRLPELVQSELDRTGFTAQRIAFEIVEDVIADGADDVLRRSLTSLSRMGCRIDLDDFGTGHASITSLQMFPVQRVKIDRSFVAGIDRSADAKRMLSAMLSMTECLQLDVLAEGIETVEELGVLRELGCSYAQGFLFSEPLPFSETERWIRDHDAASTESAQQQIRRVK